MRTFARAVFFNSFHCRGAENPEGIALRSYGASRTRTTTFNLWSGCRESNTHILLGIVTISVGVPRIELGLQPPHGRVLPLYYTPTLTMKKFSIFSQFPRKVKIFTFRPHGALRPVPSGVYPVLMQSVDAGLLFGVLPSASWRI